ncbi:Respiratory supercomplex factor 1, mitochondrial [Pseudocyphellaria aurata]|nr:Respiratory supercomplex factor 1, mitochondrial [Pseudocyphellaria aurata]
MSGGRLPSSFDHDPEFFDENWWQIVTRRLREEPLIPLGCGLTFWAFYGATRAVRIGDSNRAQIMFRRRLYAQSFTLIAAVAGSVYFKTDRTRRKEYNVKIANQKAQEKRDAWIRELEARDQDDKDWKAKMDALAGMKKPSADLKVTAAVAEKATPMKEEDAVD